MAPEPFLSWGWRVPFLMSFGVIVVGRIVRREVSETPVFKASNDTGAVVRAPVVEAIRNHWPNMLRVACMPLMNVIPVVATVFGAAYAVQPGYGIGFSKDVCLRIPVLGNILAVLLIPHVGNLADRIGRRPVIFVGALGSGLLSFAYLYAISIHNVPLAIAMSLLMWGAVYQGYNAVFPSFFLESFPPAVRVSAMAIAQNFGTMLTGLLPAVFAAISPPGSENVPVVIGSLTLGITAIAALAAFSGRETYRLRTEDLGTRNATPMTPAEHVAARDRSVSSAELFPHSAV